MTSFEKAAEWPVWFAPNDLPTIEETGYGGLARFVCPEGLERVPGAFSLGVVSRHQRLGLAGGELRRAAAVSVFGELVACEIPYTAPPFRVQQGQRMRDPEWLLHRHGAGTCLDLALLYAAACRQSGLPVGVLLLRGPELGHALVAVPLDDIDDYPLDGTARRADGVWEVTSAAELLDDTTVLLLDVTRATAATETATFEEAEEEARRLLASPDWSHLHLIDITARQERCGELPLDPPSRRGALKNRLPRPAPGWSAYGSREEARAELRQARGGRVLVHGPSGSGKTELALHEAHRADHGFGWFLNATSRAALRTSLAEAELAERGTSLLVLEQVERDALASQARARLEGSDDAWVVVLDNLDTDRSLLEELPAPKAGRGQLVVITSTLDVADWPADVLPVGLEPLELGDVTEPAEAALRLLAAGSPLLMRAFRAAVESGLVDLEALSDLPPAADASAGAQAWWSAVNGPRGLAASESALAERLAWLPPDALPPALVESAPGSTARLVGAGLLTPRGPDTLSLHRLLGGAVRTAAGPRARKRAGELLADRTAYQALLQHGDAEVVGRLPEALGADGTGLELAALAALQEVHVPKLSAGSYTAAARALGEAPAGEKERAALADCRHAQARVVNQQKRISSSDLEQALDWARQALALRDPGDTVGRAKHEALVALLRRKAARRLPRGSQEQVAEFLAVLQALEDSWEHRREALGAHDPLVDRALFNLAGAHVELAQADRPQWSDHLDRAEQVYLTTLAFREEFYPADNPLTASCLAGVGTVAYYRALYDERASRPGHLSRSVAWAVRGLELRRKLGKPDDIAKSAELLSKAALLVLHDAGGSPAEAAWEAAYEQGQL